MACHRWNIDERLRLATMRAYLAILRRAIKALEAVQRAAKR
jgi:hypothetical protein